MDIQEQPINYPGGIESIWSLEEGIKKGGHRGIQDWLNGLTNNDINTNPNAINWADRYATGGIDKATGQVLVQAGDGRAGYSQPELQLAYEKWRRGEMASDLSKVNAGLQENNRPTLGIKDHVPSNQIGQAKIQATDRGLTRIIEARDTLSSLPGGNAALSQMGEAPTISQMQGATATLNAAAAKPLQDLELEELRDRLKGNKATRALNQDNYDLNSTIAQNTQAMNEWKIKDAAAQRTFSEQEATRRAEFDMTNSNSDRALQLQLAEMSSGERRDDREYNRDRDSRKDRQLMILQLMKGLQSIGGAFQ